MRLNLETLVFIMKCHQKSTYLSSVNTNLNMYNVTDIIARSVESKEIKFAKIREEMLSLQTAIPI